MDLRMTLIPVLFASTSLVLGCAPCLVHEMLGWKPRGLNMLDGFATLMSA